ncbi:L-seryl-tRNA(Sec) selenium transferase [Candidatus Sumerlaeota bacterium]|nr:L-seryl-tRNA(Sec) selenium transferase [Candidatus Sumerlaeota bacterium]
MARQTERASERSDPRSRVPSVAVLLDDPAIQQLIGVWSRPLVLDAIRETLDAIRSELASKTVALKAGAPSAGEIVARVEAALLETEKDRLRPVVNATGIVLHTGLGRAVLPRRAVDALAGLSGCCNLQIDIETGLRGKRNYMSERLICRLTGAEAAMVVTNNAAATFLILSALCKGREVVISRGQLIEIGGSFRLPDCIHQSGATMVEVGTTNKTHLRDYEAALTENTAMILRCNPSNYRIVGFSKSVGTEKLASLKARQPFVLVDDLGCGALVNLEDYGLPKEPTVQDSLAAGADLVCFSGDKLIGGPQAGIVVGRKDLIAYLKKHPLSRMLRVGKLTDLALEQTLRLFLDPETLARENPTIRMLSAPADALKKKALRLQKSLAKRAPNLRVEVVAGESASGGGALPAAPIPTWLVCVASPDRSAEELCRLLRRHEPPVVARIADDRVALDMRTLLDGEERLVGAALAAIVS